MYILENALKNLIRNKGRNILIGAIIFAIITTTVVSLIINNTASAVIEDYKERFSSKVSITPDMQKVMQEAQQNPADGKVMMKRPEISSELYLQFTDSEYLKESIATGSIGANSNSITAIDQDEENTTEDTPSNGPSNFRGNEISMRIGGNSNFKLYGDYWQDFKDGLRSVENGKIPENDNECIISTALSDANNISVGDTLTFTSNVSIDVPDDIDTSTLADGDTITLNNENYKVALSEMGTVTLSREVTYELKVVGTYADLTDEYSNENMPTSAALNRRNEVLTTLNTLLSTRNTDESGVQVHVTYYLSSPEYLTQFEAEVRSKGLPDTFTVTTDTTSYNRIVKPVLGLKNISLTFMLVVIILGSIILVLLSSISIRERKYEIGVLRAMGMKKSKVALGLWSETLIITCICLIIGLGVGAGVSQPISDKLLSNQVEAAQNTEQQGSSQFGGHVISEQRPNGSTTPSMGGSMFFSGINQSNAQPLSEMKITLDFYTVLEIIVISILLASIAGLVSLSRITKYEPIKILMERN